MMTKDWTGNQTSIYAALGASNHTVKARQTDDYYATDPKAMELLLEVETFSPLIWECACGEGHLSKVLEKHGYEVISSDLVYRGFGEPQSFDFLKDMRKGFCGDIITNPPYKYALEFIEQALNIVQPGRKVAMFLKLTFLEGQKRKELFLHNPPKYIYVSSSRLKCAPNGDFDNCPSSAVAYAWYVWEKGFVGDPRVRWIN